MLVRSNPIPRLLFSNELKEYSPQAHPPLTQQPHMEKGKQELEREEQKECRLQTEEMTLFSTLVIKNKMGQYKQPRAYFNYLNSQATQMES